MYYYHFAVLYLFTISISNANNYLFANANDFYRSAYDNCTENEISLTKCLNGICVARTDMAQRHSLCVCFKNYGGSRCESGLLPSYFAKINFIISVIIVSAILLILLVLCIYNYKFHAKRVDAHYKTLQNSNPLP